MVGFSSQFAHICEVTVAGQTQKIDQWQQYVLQTLTKSLVCHGNTNRVMGELLQPTCTGDAINE